MKKTIRRAMLCSAFLLTTSAAFASNNVAGTLHSEYAPGNQNYISGGVQISCPNFIPVNVQDLGGTFSNMQNANYNNGEICTIDYAFPGGKMQPIASFNVSLSPSQVAPINFIQNNTSFKETVFGTDYITNVDSVSAKTDPNNPGGILIYLQLSSPDS